jgi:pimeloyl-ACP methyl ester carboxylesterase
MFEAEFAAAFEQGGVGALDDMWGFLDWGFAPEEVTQHVEMFVGDADDILDPAMSTSLFGRLPNADLQHWRRAGHYAVYGRWQEFLSAIV